MPQRHVSAGTDVHAAIIRAAMGETLMHGRQRRRRDRLREVDYATDATHGSYEFPGSLLCPNAMIGGESPVGRLGVIKARFLEPLKDFVRLVSRLVRRGDAVECIQ